MSSKFLRRLQKELKDLQNGKGNGITVVECESMDEWKVRVPSAEGSIYFPDSHMLRFRFPTNYPLESPEVIFLAEDSCPIPIHPHVYSNGHICLDVLYGEWSPAMNVQSLCVTINSMLTSCQKKKLPPDNSSYVKHCKASPKHTNWHFHDDKI